MRDIDPNLIRAYVDGELSPAVAEEVRAALEADPERRGQVEFEKQLKQRVHAAMSVAPPAPAALERAIRESIEGESFEATTAPDRSVSQPRPASDGWRSRLAAAIAALVEPIARPRPVSVGAVLGVLAIAASAVLFGVFARPIDWLATPNHQTDLVADPAEYVSQEHERCARDKDWFNRKVNICTPDEAAVALTEHFGIDSVTIFDLTDGGYEFVGEGRCDVPGARYSAHLMYERRIAGRSPAKVSIFIAAAGEDRPVFRCGVQLTPGDWHRHREGSRCRKRAWLSTDNSLVYFLVACDQSDAQPLAEIIGRTLQARAR